MKEKINLYSFNEFINSNNFAPDSEDYYDRGFQINEVETRASELDFDAIIGTIQPNGHLHIIGRIDVADNTIAVEIGNYDNIMYVGEVIVHHYVKDKRYGFDVYHTNGVKALRAGRTIIVKNK